MLLGTTQTKDTLRGGPVQREMLPVTTRTKDIPRGGRRRPASPKNELDPEATIRKYRIVQTEGSANPGGKISWVSLFLKVKIVTIDEKMNAIRDKAMELARKGGSFTEVIDGIFAAGGIARKLLLTIDDRRFFTESDQYKFIQQILEVLQQKSRR